MKIVCCSATIDNIIFCTSFLLATSLLRFRPRKSLLPLSVIANNGKKGIQTEKDPMLLDINRRLALNGDEFEITTEDRFLRLRVHADDFSWKLYLSTCH